MSDVYAPSKVKLARALGISRPWLVELTHQPWWPERRPGGWHVGECHRAIEQHVDTRPGRRRRRPEATPEQLQAASAPQPVTPEAVAGALAALAELPGPEGAARIAEAHRHAHRLVEAAMLGSEPPPGVAGDVAAELGELLDQLAIALAGATLVERGDVASWLRELLGSVPAWSAAVDEAEAG